MKIPKKGTRVRAVIDCLYLAHPDDVVKWSDLRDAYGAPTGPLPPLRTRSRQYIGMSMAPTLRRYATKVLRGRYQLKGGVRTALDGLNHEPLGYPACRCGAHTWEHLITSPKLSDTLEKVRGQLRNEGYFGHWVNKPCIEDSYTEQARLKRSSIPPVILKEPVFTENIDAVLKNMGKVGQVMLNEQELDDDKCKDPECPLCDPTPVKATDDFYPLTEVIRHGGIEPDMDDICGTCGERYGNHFGNDWPAPADCPDTVGGLLLRAEEGKRFKFWSPARPAVQGAPEIEDMAWHQKFNDAYDYKAYGSAGLEAVGELKRVIKDLRLQLEDTISQEMHLDAMAHKDNEILHLKNGNKQLEEVLENYQSDLANMESEIQDRDQVIANQMRANLELTGQRNALEWKLKQIRNLTED